MKLVLCGICGIFQISFHKNTLSNVLWRVMCACMYNVQVLFYNKIPESRDLPTKDVLNIFL